MSSTMVDTVDLNRPYVYPMSNATNGGESHTEYNVRSSLSNLLSYSAAFSENDFAVGGFNFIQQPERTGISLYISSGKGNCNSYFISADDFGSETSPKFIPINPSAHVPSGFIPNVSSARFGLYVSVKYTQNIADGLRYYFICDGFKPTQTDSFSVQGTEYESIYTSEYEPQGFNDIGIKLGSTIYNGSDFSSFIRNPDITRCMDISRFGSESDFAEKLSQLVSRLQTLNIYGGDLYLSNTLVGDNFLDSSEIIDHLGADIRIKLHTELNDYNSNEWDSALYYVLTDKNKPNAESELNTIFNRAIYSKNGGAWNKLTPNYGIYRHEPGQNYSTIGNNQVYRFSNDITTYSDSNLYYINYGNDTLRGVYKYTTNAPLYQDDYSKLLFLVKSGSASTKFKDPTTNVEYNMSQSNAYIYTDSSDATITHLVQYLNGAWKDYQFKILSSETDTSTLDLNTNYVVLLPTKNIYYYTDNGEIKRYESNGTETGADFEKFPIPVAKKYYFDGSGRNIFPTGTKLLSGSLSLVKCNLGGQDDTIFEIAKFSTKPFITPYTQLDTMGRDSAIEIDNNGIQFIQSISATSINANNINTDNLNVSTIKFDNNAELHGGVDSLGNSAVITNNSIVANKVFGAVWM